MLTHNRTQNNLIRCLLMVRKQIMKDELAYKGSDIEKLISLLYFEQQDRKILASELHKSKSVIHLALIMIGKLTKTETNQKEVEILKELLSDYVTEFRKTFYELHPPFVEDIGLQKAIIILTKNYSEKEGLEINFSTNQLEKINNYALKQIVVFKTIKNIIQLCKTIGVKKSDFEMIIQKSDLEISITNIKIETVDGLLHGEELLIRINAQLTWIKAKILSVTDWRNKIAFKVCLSEM